MSTKPKPKVVKPEADGGKPEARGMNRLVEYLLWALALMIFGAGVSLWLLPSWKEGVQFAEIINAFLSAFAIVALILGYLQQAEQIDQNQKALNSQMKNLDDSIAQQEQQTEALKQQAKSLRMGLLLSVAPDFTCTVVDGTEN